MALFRVTVRASASGTPPDSLMERRVYFIAALDEEFAKLRAMKRARNEWLENIHLLSVMEVKS
jgi:hypothetical protein